LSCPLNVINKLNNSNSLLTIAISTVSTQIKILLEKLILVLPSINKNINFLLIVQGNKKYNGLPDYPNNIIKIIFSDTIGLSCSRNIAINNVNSQWIWFQDDDIEINIGEIDKLINALNLSNSDVFLTKILSLESKKEYYKNYSYYKFSHKRIALRVSSIEIIVKAEFLLKNKIKFDDRMGLGSSYPCGEENLFMLQILKCGGILELSEIAPSYHTTKQDNRYKNTKGHLIARGILLQEFSIILAFFVAIKWSFDERFNNNILSTFKYILEGYFKK